MELSQKFKKSQRASKLNRAPSCSGTGATTKNKHYINSVHKKKYRGNTYIFIKNLKQKALIDSGSSTSIITPALITGPVEPTHITLTDVTGREIKVVGVVKLRLDLGYNIKLRQRFIVAPIENAPVILGLDFIKEHGVTLDFNKKSISLRNKYISLLVSEDKSTNPVFMLQSTKSQKPRRRYRSRNYYRSENNIREPKHYCSDSRGTLSDQSLEEDQDQPSQVSDLSLNSSQQSLLRDDHQVLSEQLLTPTTGYFIFERNLAYPFLVDCGATSSIITQKLMQPRSTKTRKLSSASGKTIETVGKVTLELDLGFKEPMTHSFVIAKNLAVQAILGSDFLLAQRLVLNGKTVCLQKECQDVPLMCGKLTSLQLKYTLLENTLDMSWQQQLQSREAIEISKSEKVHYRIAAKPEERKGDNMDPHCVNLIAPDKQTDTPDCQSPFTKRCLDLLKHFPSITATPNYQLPPKHPFAMDIVLSDYSPLKQRARTCTPGIRKLLRETFCDWENRGIVERNSPSHVCPTTVVSKKNGDFRVCIDYTRLNKVTEWINYPLPQINSLTSFITPEHRIFSVIDLKEAYFSLPLTKRASELAGIIVPDGSYSPRRCQFGLKNAPFKYCELIDHVTNGLRHFVFTYLDDFIVFSQNKEQHLKHLRLILARLETFGLFINRKKSCFGKPVVTFLGRTISASGIVPEVERIQHILEQKPPQTLRALRSFLGMVNHYRPHLPALAEIAAPLFALLQGPKRAKRSPIPWNPECQNSFEEVLKKIQDAVELSFDDPALPLIISSDASQFHVGASLEQEDPSEPGTRRPLAFFSKALPKTRQVRSAFNRELCALRMTLQYFRHRVRGRPLTILTDNKALSHALINGVGQHSPLEIAWLDEIREYHPDIRHIEGKTNFVADFLSRPNSNVKTGPPILESGCEDLDANQQLAMLSTGSNVDASQNPEGSDNLTPSMLAEAQQEENLTEAINNESLTVGEKEFDDPDQGAVKLTGVIHSETGDFTPYVPIKLRPSVFSKFHETAHLGGEKTVESISALYFWPSLRKDVLHWAKHCPQCQSNKITRHNRQRLHNFPSDPGRLHIVHMDLVGPLPSIGNFPYILTIRDRNTGFLVTAPLRDKTSESVISEFAQNFIAKFGIPEKIITDQGREFISQKFSAFCDHLGIQHAVINSYHAQANGAIERVHRILKSSIRSLRDPGQWHTSLPYITLQLNNHTSGINSFTSYQFVFGRPGRLPGALIQSDNTNPMSGENMRAFMSLMMTHQPEYRPLRDNNPFIEKELFTAEACWLRIDGPRTPIEPLYSGPYEVLHRSDKTFRLLVKGMPKSVSIDRLKAYRTCKEQSCLEATLKPRTRLGRLIRRPARFIVDDPLNF